MSKEIVNTDEEGEFPENWYALGNNREVIATGGSLMEVMIAVKNAKKTCKIKRYKINDP